MQRDLSKFDLSKFDLVSSPDARSFPRARGNERASGDETKFDPSLAKSKSAGYIVTMMCVRVWKISVVLQRDCVLFQLFHGPLRRFP